MPVNSAKCDGVLAVSWIWQVRCSEWPMHLSWIGLVASEPAP